jgi:hypothetical protein
MISEMLPYATGPARKPARWRRIARRVFRYLPLLLLIVALAVGILVSFRWPWVWYGSRDEYQWHRWLNFTMSAEKVVYEEDPGRATRLLSLPSEPASAYVGDPRAGNFSLSNDYTFHSSTKSAMYCPAMLRALLMYDRPALAFIHWRSAPTTGRALILVTSDWSSNGLRHRDIVYLSARRCTHDECVTGKRALNHRTGWNMIEVRLRPEQMMRIYAGQVDPKDDAHFTIKYEIDNVPGTIDGRLEADDTVTLKFLDGPAKALATSQPSSK